uniref:Small-subunit processome Utp12 domain-containing protein n=1 Tax=Lankesteria abbotti TaxID=340204 RepID=A0A7S2VTN1_9APIC
MKKLSETDLIDSATDVVFSSDGKLLAVPLLDSRIQLIFADTLHIFLTLYGHKLPVNSVSMSSDCTLLASGSADKSVKIWGMDFGNIQKSFIAHEDSVTRVAFVFDTHYLVSVGGDGRVKLWDIDTKELITQLYGHHKTITALALSQDAERIVTTGFDKSIRMWMRSDEQFVLEEERDREMDARLDQDSIQDGMISGVESHLTKATRKTFDAVKSAEKLIEVIDQASEQLDSEMGFRSALAEWETASLLSKHVVPPRPAAPKCHTRSAHECVLDAVSSLTAYNVHEVLLSLPFAHAEKLLVFLADFLNAFLESSGIDVIEQSPSSTSTTPNPSTTPITTSSSSSKHFLSKNCYPIEMPLRVVLILVQLHHRVFVSSLEHRGALLRLHKAIGPIVEVEKDRLSFCRASLELLRRQAG